jgi:hypothetical protein
MLRRQFFRERMIEGGMTRFEFREKLAHAAFKPGQIRGEQFIRMAIDALGPSIVINARDVDMVGANKFLYCLQNLSTFFGI